MRHGFKGFALKIRIKRKPYDALEYFITVVVTFFWFARGCFSTRTSCFIWRFRERNAN
jgi:hypothetical protein